MKLSLIKTLILFLMCCNTLFAADIYVDENAPAGGDGTTWATAYNDLETAVAASVANDVIRIIQ